MAEKRKKKTYVFNKYWEDEEFFFTSIRDKCVCLICGATVAISKRHNVERHYQTTHGSLNTNFPPQDCASGGESTWVNGRIDQAADLFHKTAEEGQKDSRSFIQSYTLFD